MQIKTSPPWARAALASGLLALALFAGAAQAALVRFHFELDFVSGPLGGQTAQGSFDVAMADCVAYVCTGTFTPSGPANGIVGPTGTLLDFNVVVDGIAFGGLADDLYPDFPSIELAGNQIARIDFMDLSGPPSLTIFGSALGGWGGAYTDAAFDTSLIGNLRQIGGGTPIPEPATVLLVAAALLGLRATPGRQAR